MRKPIFLPLIKLAIVLLLTATFQSCAVNPVTGKKEFMLLSKGGELALGQQYDPSVVAMFGMYDDPKIQQFIEAKGQEMARISHRPELPYEFKVLDSPVVNAFAVPGGFVYFTRGILAHFNNEAEFAGVLGHEIGHITARHSAKQYSRQVLAQIGLVAGMVVSEDFARYADVAQTGLGLLFLKYGRDAESQSDRLGVEYSTKIGYDAREMAGFFLTLQRLGGGGDIPTFLSTHPDPGDRHITVNRQAREMQQQMERSNFNVNRNEYLSLIDGMVYGEDPRQGYFEGNMFYHPVLKFQFPVPNGWRTVNTPNEVQMAPQDGKAVMLLSLSQESNLNAAADAALQQYQMTQISRQNEQVNGLPALMVAAQQANQQTQQVISALIYFIQYEGRIYRIAGLSYQQDFANYLSRFQQSMTGFRQLTDPARLNAQPDRIRIKRIENNTTLQAALSEAGIPNNRLEEFAIINGMQLSDNLTRGILIKVMGK